MKPRILVLCTANSARSQMAEALMRQAWGGDFDIASAGTHASFVRPEAIEAMAEIGIDISGHRSKSVAEFAGQEFAYVFTVCDHARDNCPVFPGGGERIHWGFEDPAAATGSPAERLAAFRRIREEIAARIRGFQPQV